MAVKRPLDVYEAYNRSIIGEKISEDDWDYTVISPIATELKEKYHLRFGDEIIPSNDDVCDVLFMAGMDMLISCGMYNVTTGRIIEVSAEEIYETLKNCPKKLELGSGRQRVECSPRRYKSSRRPIIQGGPTGTPVSEDIFVPMIQSYAQEKGVDTIVSGIMDAVNGNLPTTNSPWEVKATLAEIRNVREGCRLAGRDGMGI